MTKKVINYTFAVVIFFTATAMYAKRTMRRQGSITEALQKQPTPTDPFISESALHFDSPLASSTSSISELTPQAIVDAATPDQAETAATATAVAPQLSKELQEKAQKELARVEQQKEEEEEKIELQFENADLQNLVQQIAELFNVTFITDDAIDPLPKGTTDAPTKALRGNKITFKTSTPLTRQQAWDLFLTFLNVSGLGITQQSDPLIYRIQTLKANHKAPLPTFIGVDHETLPDNDQMIRYLYFLENSSIESMKAVIPALQSSSAAAPILLQEHKAIILTDKSYNIKALMKIVKELDKVTFPQAMSIIKLREADATEVRKLYDELTQQPEEERSPFRPFGARRQPTAIYFPENARVIEEPRTNSLILLGPKDAIGKIEEFITKYVDVSLDKPYSPLYTYQLQYADAKVVAEIMNNTTKLGQETAAGKSGGVRGQDKYLKDMNFTAEPGTNKLIIRGDYHDYLATKEIIEKLDEPQPQVAIEVLILSVALKDNKELGVQLRSKIPGLNDTLGANVVFQTSGLRAGGSPSKPVTNPDGPGVERLLGNLLKLVTNATTGNTILTLGQDAFGVWGIFQALQTITNLQVISNPFLVASNKTPASVSLGEKRRIVTGVIKGGTTDEQTFGDDSAKLQVDIVPQINSDGMVVLKLRVELTEFTNPLDPTSGQKTTKLIETQAIVADREVLALGGLIRNTVKAGVSKVPILGDIPLLGWLFKNQSKSVNKDSLLILMSIKIIPAHATSEVNLFTQERLGKYRNAIGQYSLGESHDPIHKVFFSEAAGRDDNIGEFLFERHQKSRRKERKLKRTRERIKAQKEKKSTKNQIPSESEPDIASNKIDTPHITTTPLHTTTADAHSQTGKSRQRHCVSEFLLPHDHRKLT